MLPTHTPLSESVSLLRTAAYLTKRGAAVTDAERDVYYQARKQDILDRAKDASA